MTWPYQWQQPEPSPHCGRIDDHEPHPWTTPSHRAAGGDPYQCPGPPTGSVPYPKERP